MKFAHFLLLSLVLHGLVVLTLRPRELPIQDLSQIEVIETYAQSTKSAGNSSVSAKRDSTQKNISKSEEKISLNSKPAQENASSDSVPGNSNVVEAVSVGSVTEIPRVLKEKKIPYPASAKRAGVDGVVQLKLVINQQGAVESAELVNGPGYGLNEAALGAIKDFIFSPAKIGANSVPVRILYKYRFVLGGL